MKLTTNRADRFLNRYRILSPLFGFTLGILINQYTDNVWVLIAVMAIVFGILSVFFTKLRFLLMIPIGLLFSANPLLNDSGNIEKFIDTTVAVEGTLYRSPEQRERGSRLFLDTDFVIIDGVTEPAGGKVVITTGDFIEGLALGDRIRVLDVRLRGLRNFLNPGGFDLKSYYGRQGIRASGFVEGEESIISFGIDRSSNPALHRIDSLRNRFAVYVSGNFPSPQSAVYNAITVGYKGGIPRELRTDFSRAGVAHILAISGLHVGAVALFFYLLIRFVLARSEYLLLRFQVPRLAAGLTIIPVFLYTAIAGFSTSAMRAFIMISLYLASIVLGRDENKINTLAAAALIILIWHPWSLFELSFRLSFSAVFAILLVHRFYPFKFGTLRDKFYSIVKSTIAAGFVTLPFIVNSFGILPTVSIPANIIFLPFVEFLVIPLGLISFMVFFISPYLADPIVSFNIVLIDILVFGVRKLTEIPYSFFTMPGLSLFSWILFISTGLALLLLNSFTRLKYLIPFLIIGFLISSAVSVKDDRAGGTLEVNFLDAGAGKSAVYITLPEGKNILIDGGYTRFGGSGYTERAVIARYLLSRGVRDIDYLILTSSDKDHLEGVKYLLENFTVNNFLTNGDKLEGGVWEIIYDRHIDWRDILTIQNRLAIGESELHILTPGSDFAIKDSSLPYPVALKLTSGNTSILLGEALHLDTVQRSLMTLYGERLKSSVLYTPAVKEDSAFRLFLNTVSPEVLVTGSIESSGEPNYLKRAGMEIPVDIFQTMTAGMVTIQTDGSGLIIKTFTGE